MEPRLRLRAFALGLIAWAGALAGAAQPQAGGAPERWDKYIGETAPRLNADSWSGTPVSLDAVRGNCVILAFWNGDIPC